MVIVTLAQVLELCIAVLVAQVLRMLNWKRLLPKRQNCYLLLVVEEVQGRTLAEKTVKMDQVVGLIGVARTDKVAVCATETQNARGTSFSLAELVEEVMKVMATRDVVTFDAIALTLTIKAITGVPAGLVGMSCRHVVCVLQ